jgi:hypothetical protein
MLLARSDVGRRGPAMEALFGLYDALEASAQEGLAAPPDGADAAAVAAAGVQLLDELRTRFARLVRRCLMLAVRDCRLARLVRRCHVPGAALSCAGGGVPSARARLLRAARRGRGARRVRAPRAPPRPTGALTRVRRRGQAVGDTWDKTPEQGPLRLMALKRIFKFYVRPLQPPDPTVPCCPTQGLRVALNVPEQGTAVAVLLLRRRWRLCAPDLLCIL